MPSLGQISKLKVIEKVADGVYLDGGELEAIFLPSRDLPDETAEGDVLEVFLYLDTRELVVATTATPHAVVGECAMLQVLSVGKYGAFLDWGLAKDLLLPHSEQAYPVEEGKEYVVYVFQDERSGRIAASTKLHFHLEESSGPYQVGDQVDLLIAANSELGYKAVINGAYLGLVYESDLSQPLNFGDKMKGWIKAVRDDGKVDLSINTLDAETRDELEQAVMDKLTKSGGILALSDKSAPEDIFKTFKVSKKNFKRAISALYKQRLIRIQPDSIELLSSASAANETEQKREAAPKKEHRSENEQRPKREQMPKRTSESAVDSKSQLSLKKPASQTPADNSKTSADKQVYKQPSAKQRQQPDQSVADASDQPKPHANAHIYGKRK